MLYLIVLLFLVLNNFFGASSINNNLLILLLIPFLFKGLTLHSIYKPFFILFGVGMLLNFFSCYYFRDQGFYDSFLALTNFYSILYLFFYFALKTLQPSIKTVERVLLFLIIAFDIIYILSFFLIPYGIKIVKIEDWMIGEDSNSTRLRIMSSGLYSLGIFYGINKYIFTKKNIYLLCVVLGVIVTFLAAYRSVLLSVFIGILYLFYKINGFNKKIFIYLLFGGFFMFGIVQIPIVSEKMEYIISRQTEGNESLLNEDYIRVIQFKYYTQERTKNAIEYVLGSGMPYAKSNYGQDYEGDSNRSLVYVDWGLIGLSWMLGILPVLAMILYSIKVIRLKVDAQYKYIGIWFLFLLSVSLFNIEFYRNGNFLVQAIALYIIELAYQERRLKTSSFEDIKQYSL